MIGSVIKTLIKDLQGNEEVLLLGSPRGQHHGQQTLQNEVKKQLNSGKKGKFSLKKTTKFRQKGKFSFKKYNKRVGFGRTDLVGDPEEERLHCGAFLGRRKTTGKSTFRGGNRPV